MYTYSLFVDFGVAIAAVVGICAGFLMGLSVYLVAGLMLILLIILILMFAAPYLIAVSTIFLVPYTLFIVFFLGLLFMRDKSERRLIYFRRLDRWLGSLIGATLSVLVLLVSYQMVLGFAWRGQAPYWFLAAWTQPAIESAATALFGDRLASDGFSDWANDVANVKTLSETVREAAKD